MYISYLRLFIDIPQVHLTDKAISFFIYSADYDFTTAGHLGSYPVRMHYDVLIYFVNVCMIVFNSQRADRHLPTYFKCEMKLIEVGFSKNKRLC